MRDTTGAEHIGIDNMNTSSSGGERGPSAATVRSGLIASAAVVAVSVAGLFGSGVAEAAPAAVVKATTQRMSDATLRSAQIGTYARGRTLSLTCYKRGQSVKGYFSRYIPGGWDNLWYRTSDGGFVADVDIDTRSNNPVTGPCAAAPAAQAPAPAPAPAPSQGNKAARAVSWALSQQRSNAYPSLCLLFVARAYGQGAANYETALVMYKALLRAGQIRTSSANSAPAGALVFSQSSDDFGQGHVDLAVGDGTFISGGVLPSYRNGGTVQRLATPNPSRGASYLGWAYAPSNWPGR